jgi:hypothetical protein
VALIKFHFFGHFNKNPSFSKPLIFEMQNILVERQRVKRHKLSHFDKRIRSLKPTSFHDFQLSAPTLLLDILRVHCDTRRAMGIESHVALQKSKFLRRCVAFPTFKIAATVSFISSFRMKEAYDTDIA